MGPSLEEQLKFHYDPSPQRSAAWLARKRGKIGASRLEDWLAVSKAKATMGKPLKARLDYEKELMFERQFGVSFETYVNSAMQEGIDYEDFARAQYEQITGKTCVEVGCYYNAFMAVSPDREVDQDGLIEIKIVKDNTFTDILMNGVPSKHWKQIQAQLLASGRKWCDYVALNFNTKRLVIIRVEPDLEFHEYLMEAIQEKLVTEPFALDKVHQIVGEIPEGVSLGAEIDRSDSNTNAQDWSK